MLPRLIRFFEAQKQIQFALLFGSRARQAAAPKDWDLAIYFADNSQEQVLDRLGLMEQLRTRLARELNCQGHHVDLVDLRRAPLNLCITVAEEGKILKGGGSLELFRFYQSAWSQQEEFHFRKAHGC